MGRSWARARRPLPRSTLGGGEQTSWRRTLPSSSAVESEFVAASADAAQADDRRRRRSSRRLRTLDSRPRDHARGRADRRHGRGRSSGTKPRSRRQLAEGIAAEARQAAFDAKVGAMAAIATARAESNPGQSMLLALEADRLRPGRDTLGALKATLVARPAVTNRVAGDTPFVHVVGDPNGTTISGGTWDGRVVVEELATGRVVDEWKITDGPVVGARGATGWWLGSAVSEHRGIHHGNARPRPRRHGPHAGRRRRDLAGLLLRAVRSDRSASRGSPSAPSRACAWSTWRRATRSGRSTPQPWAGWR